MIITDVGRETSTNTIQLPYDPAFGHRLLGLMTEDPEISEPSVSDAIDFVYPLIDLATVARVATNVQRMSIVNDSRAIYMGLQGDSSADTFREAIEGINPEAPVFTTNDCARRLPKIPKRIISHLHVVEGYEPVDLRNRWQAFIDAGTPPVTDPITFPEIILARRAQTLVQPMADHMITAGLRSLRRILAPEGMSPKMIAVAGAYLLKVCDAEKLLPELTGQVEVLQTALASAPESHSYLAFALVAAGQETKSGLAAILDELPQLDVHIARKHILKSLAQLAASQA